MPEKVSKKTAVHYQWGNNCEGWRLKKENNFTVIVESMPAGSEEINRMLKKSEKRTFSYLRTSHNT